MALALHKRLRPWHETVQSTGMCNDINDQDLPREGKTCIRFQMCFSPSLFIFTSPRVARARRKLARQASRALSTSPTLSSPLPSHHYLRSRAPPYLFFPSFIAILSPFPLSFFVIFSTLVLGIVFISMCTVSLCSTVMKVSFEHED